MSNGNQPQQITMGLPEIDALMEMAQRSRPTRSELLWLDSLRTAIVKQLQDNQTTPEEAGPSA